jgi:hypothetical protein
MASTVPGAILQVKNAFGDLTDELGVGFQDIAVDALKVLTDALRGVSDWLKQLSPEAKELGAKIALVATGALGVVTALGGIGLAMPGLIALFSSFGTVMLGAVLPALPYILGIAMAIAGVILTVGLLRTAWDTNFAHFKDIITWHIEAWKSLVDGIKSVVGWILDANQKMADAIDNVLGKIKNSSFGVNAGMSTQEGRHYVAGQGWVADSPESGSTGIAGWGTGAGGTPEAGVVSQALGFLGDTSKAGLDTILGLIKGMSAGLFPTMDVLRRSQTPPRRDWGT